MEIINTFHPTVISALVSFSTNFVLAFDVAAGEMTPGRARALVGAVIGLVSLIVGVIAFFRSGRPIGPIVALALGVLGGILGVIHLALSTGGFGTGAGRAGAVVGLVFSVIGIALGGIAFSRSRSRVSTAEQ